MKAPKSWILEYVDVPEGTTTDELTARLTLTGLKLEAIASPGKDITGPLVVGRVLTMEPEPQKNGKTINWCTVDVGDANGTGEPQGIVCGAHNFEPGDLVVVVLPGGVLPGGFAISARKTYGHVSAGMICSAQELGLGEDGPAQHEPRPAGVLGDDLGVVPGHPPWRAERLREGLLRGEPRREGGERASRLGRGEEPGREPARARQRLPEALDVDHVDPDAHDHGRLTPP